MPKMLGKDLTQQQMNELQNMLRRWKAESKSFLRDIERAINQRLRRNPREMARVLDQLRKDINKKVREMQMYKDKASSAGSIDEMIRNANSTAEEVVSASAAAKMFADGEMSASDAAEALRDLHTTLTNYTEMVEKFNTHQTHPCLLYTSPSPRDS